MKIHQTNLTKYELGHTESSNSLSLASYVTLHSQNHVPRETAPAGRGRDTGNIRHARKASSFENCRDTAYPEKCNLTLK